MNEGWRQQEAAICGIFINYKIFKYRMRNAHKLYISRGPAVCCGIILLVPVIIEQSMWLQLSKKSCLLLEFKDFSNISFIHCWLHHSSAFSNRFLSGWTAGNIKHQTKFGITACPFYFFSLQHATQGSLKDHKSVDHPRCSVCPIAVSICPSLFFFSLFLTKTYHLCLPLGQQ